MKKKITFTIQGNQEDRTGNAIPCLRTTRNTQWTKNAKRYSEWKDYVRAAYLDAVLPLKKISREEFADYHDLIQKKPIPASKKRAHMNLFIFWKDDTHGDCDNIFKGIADALFENDKYLSGEFNFQQAVNKNGLVMVEITLNADDKE